MEEQDPIINCCPCCSSPLLRHIHSSKVYWFCPSCRQEMPNLTPKTLPKEEPKNQLDSHTHNFLKI